MNYREKLIHGYKVKIGLAKSKINHYEKLKRNHLVEAYKSDIVRYEDAIKRLSNHE